ncbi:hypothetical protein AJ80_00017 [Polytolypa hystricis UAMH7299]|uniref:Uncharacterized protein n=1 Tax=Polytolypa hystricis (strain UAMH7299) TaxID=1447883 RepID=A0A2B7Z5K1_POLH7|nr:hypothetical protein AJ80_00017 [Polytolypa hystricis UAMH7299]
MYTPEGEIMSAMSTYEPDTGIRWNRVAPGFNLLRNAGYEAKQLDPDTTLVRSLFITSLKYLLDAMPLDLSDTEASGIRERIPSNLRSSECDTCSNVVDSSSSSSSSGESGNKRPRRRRRHHHHHRGEGDDEMAQGAAPSIVHRVLASGIVQFCVLLQFLIPYVKILFARVQRSERVRQVAVGAVGWGVSVIKGLSSGSADGGGVGGRSSVFQVGDGRVTDALWNVVWWWLVAVSGGVFEGIGDGASILGGMDKGGEGRDRSKDVLRSER